MRVVALGAGGAMGAAAATLVAAFPEVSELMVADRRLDAAERVADALHRPGLTVTASVVDVLDQAGLRAALSGAAAVINTSGPFYRLGVPALEAAISVGCHYLDICDDPGPTRALLDLDSSARAAGVTAVIGVGASPGLSNLLAVCAAQGLDLVDDLYCAWPVDAGTTSEAGATRSPDSGSGMDRTELVATDGGPSAAVAHWLQQLRATVPVYRGGSLIQQQPLRPVRLNYPGRRGGSGYVVGHPEPLTLGPNLGVRGTSASLMILTPGTAGYLRGLTRDLDAGRLTEAAAARLVVAPSRRRRLAALLTAARLPGPGDLPPFFAIATGWADGQRKVVAAELVGLPLSMSAVTAAPLALGLREILRGLRRAGVHAPEQVFDAQRMLSALGECPAVHGSAGPPVLTVVSAVPTRC